MSANPDVPTIYAALQRAFCNTLKPFIDLSDSVDFDPTTTVDPQKHFYTSTTTTDPPPPHTNEGTVENVTPPSTGLKFDSTKPDYSLLDFPYIESLIAVLTHGAEKYTRDNWKLFHPSDIPRFASAIMRHTAAILQGELIDPDSGLPHASHIAAEAMFIHHHGASVQNPTPQHDTPPVETVETVETKECLRHARFAELENSHLV